MASGPRRFLLSRWPWRCLTFLAATSVVGIIVLLITCLLIVTVPPATILLGLAVGRVERHRLSRFSSSSLASPHALPPPGLGAWLRLRAREAATWREFAYLFVLALVLPVASLAAIGVVLNLPALAVGPLVVAFGGTLPVGGGLFTIETAGAAWIAAVVGVLGTIPGVYALCALAGLQAAVARRLLAPRQSELRQRVEELARSRARLVDAFDAERRRIERDLHDGAQQHLVLLTMTLGLASLELEGSDGPARGLVIEAHRQARQALSAIRELVHGIHPRVLADLGLAAAVGELAERCPLPVEVDVRLPRRLPAMQESIAYFVVCEAVTNAIKHAAATRIAVCGRITVDRLVIEVTDDGTGGADPSRGSGLRGLADRTAVLNGSIAITSPPGGPTALRMELPCHFA